MSTTWQEHKTHGTGAHQNNPYSIFYPLHLMPPSPFFFFPSLPAGSASTYWLRREGTSWRTFNSSSISAGLKAGIGEQNSSSSSLRKVSHHQLCVLSRALGQKHRTSSLRSGTAGEGEDSTAACLPGGLVYLDQKLYDCSRAALWKKHFLETQPDLLLLEAQVSPDGSTLQSDDTQCLLYCTPCSWKGWWAQKGYGCLNLLYETVPCSCCICTCLAETTSLPCPENSKGAGDGRKCYAPLYQMVLSLSCDTHIRHISTSHTSNFLTSLFSRLFTSHFPLVLDS